MTQVVDLVYCVSSDRGGQVGARAKTKCAVCDCWPQEQSQPEQQLWLCRVANAGLYGGCCCESLTNLTTSVHDITRDPPSLHNPLQLTYTDQHQVHTRHPLLPSIVGHPSLPSTPSLPPT